MSDDESPPKCFQAKCQMTALQWLHIFVLCTNRPCELDKGTTRTYLNQEQQAGKLPTYFPNIFLIQTCLFSEMMIQKLCVFGFFGNQENTKVNIHYWDTVAENTYASRVEPGVERLQLCTCAAVQQKSPKLDTAAIIHRSTRCLPPVRGRALSYLNQ